MSISDKSFEAIMKGLENALYCNVARDLRARDTAQREALARVETALAAKPAMDLANACIQHLIDSGAENYVGNQFEFTVDGEDVARPVIVTVQFADRPSAHEQLVKAKEDLARVEADLKREKAEAWELCGIVDARTEERDTAQAQLAEAVGVIQNIAQTLEGQEDCRSMRQAQSLRKFLARHARAEQQEAESPMSKMAEGLRQKAADEWANHPSNPANQEAQGAQAGDDAIKLFERIISQSPADLDKATEDNPWYQVMASEVRAFAAALATQPADERAGEMGYRSAINALDDLDRYKMAMVPAKAAPEATQKQLNDLHNFFSSVCEGGLHSIEKAGIQSLTELGALENCGFGKHRLTRFGTYLLDQTAVRGADHA